jgi:hypothetical protein
MKYRLEVTVYVIEFVSISLQTIQYVQMLFIIK